MTRTVLLLAGTQEAREIASGFDRPDLRLVASLAGVTTDPLAYPCKTRVGGFGGALAMAEWLRRESAVAIVDATHPFAEQISSNAREAAAQAGIPCLRLHRAPWLMQPEWREVETVEAAVAALPSGATALMTTGRAGLEAIAARGDVRFLLRSIVPVPGLPEAVTPVLARPPYTMESERDLLRHHSITHVVTKNAGGAVPAKMQAATAEDVATLVVRMPPPLGLTVTTVREALDWIEALP